MEKFRVWLLFTFLTLGAGGAFAQNPLITDQFTADPTARVFDGKLYIYPSHDINCGTDWFCMEDYHVFSSDNLIDWTDHGVVLSQYNVSWVDSTKFSMWAPDCYERGGKYYFYFPSIADTNTGVKGMAVGVATSDKPYGPFKPEPMPIKGISGIDPCVFVDDDGQAYIYWAGMGALRGAKLNDNMLELASEPVKIETLPEGMKEGPYVFKRNDIYYFTFPHVIDTTEALVYAMGSSPLGPFEYKGLIMDEHPSHCWTNHHSIVQYKGQWYLFYHHNDLSPEFDKNRSIRADSISFNEDGTIVKVIPTLRGVGITPADREIQIDRYTGISNPMASIEFLDPDDKFQGWKTILADDGAWVKYNSVDFADKNWKSVKVKAFSEKGGSINIHYGSGENDVVTVNIPAGNDWQLINAELNNVPSGIRNIKVVLNSGYTRIDWVSFSSEI